MPVLSLLPDISDRSLARDMLSIFAAAAVAPRDHRRRVTSAFNHTVSVLPPEIATELRDLIVSPPATTPFDTLTSELIQRTTMPEQRRWYLLQSEKLGDRKPSQILRRLQQLLGESEATFDQALFREIFLQRLPTSVCMVLAPARGLTISQLAQLADSVMDVSTPVERLAFNVLVPERSRPTKAATCAAEPA